jgi:hypothetical protein
MKMGGSVTGWIEGQLSGMASVDQQVTGRTDRLTTGSVAVDTGKWPIFKRRHRAFDLRRVAHPQPAPAFVAEAAQGFDVARLRDGVDQRLRIVSRT